MQILQEVLQEEKAATRQIFLEGLAGEQTRRLLLCLELQGTQAIPKRTGAVLPVSGGTPGGAGSPQGKCPRSVAAGPLGKTPRSDSSAETRRGNHVGQRMDDGIGNRMKEGEPDTKNEGEMRREKRGSANGRSGTH